jgi:carboxymethylenebutenolidase
VHGAVVLVHDVWGLYDHFRELADRLAAAGFVTLAIELYRRTPELKISDAGAFMRELSDPDVLADIQAGVDSLRPHGRVAVIGFCMGGMYALLSGAALRDVSAVVPFYGILSHAHGLLFSETGLDAKKKPKEPVRAARELRCPMLAYYGDQDVYVPITDIDALREQASASGQRCEIHVVPGAGHAFMNETRTQAYVPDAARAAWQRMLEFLRSELRG